jgi:hypothetical protein
MENSTPKQRLPIYKQMLIEMERYQSFCSMAKSACAKLGYPYNTFASRPIEDYLPELMAYKPAVIFQSGYWFEGPEAKSQKTAILQEIIKKLETPKIKSVILADEFNNGLVKVKAGAPVDFLDRNGFYHISGTGIRFPFSEEQIRENAVGLFKIELETEFEFYAFDTLTNFYNANLEFNRLRLWCDEQSLKDIKYSSIIYYVYYSKIAEKLYIDSGIKDKCFSGLKFNSKESAELFISELNKPANKSYKNCFIDLLKKNCL